MGASLNIHPARKGVTLVEILVVIVIIGILTALIMGGMGMARARTRLAIIKTEISQLDMALNTYKTKYGETPPSFVNIDIVAERTTGVVGDAALQADGRADVMRHLRKAFPRYVPGQPRLGSSRPNPDSLLDSTDFEHFAADVYYACCYPGDPTADISLGSWTPTIYPLRFDAASSLVFFLGGIPEGVPDPSTGEAWIPAGFHADPARPFRQGLPRNDPLYKFILNRIVLSEPHCMNPTDPDPAVVVDRYLRYYPDGATGDQGAPIVYFKSQRVNNVWQYGALNSGSTLVQYDYWHAGVDLDPGNNCVAYRDPEPQVLWRNHDTFQIISAGLDGLYGYRRPAGASVHRFSKTGVNFAQCEYDNLTNFSANTLEDEISQ